jgi:hypothetical protein
MENVESSLNVISRKKNMFRDWGVKRYIKTLDKR